MPKQRNGTWEHRWGTIYAPQFGFDQIELFEDEDDAWDRYKEDPKNSQFCEVYVFVPKGGEPSQFDAS